MEQVCVKRFRNEKKRGGGTLTRSVRKRNIFLITMLALPIAQWAVFWLFVNVNSILLAFKDQRTAVLTFGNFITFWESLSSPAGDIAVAMKNTLVYFGANILLIIPISLVMSYFIYKRIFCYKFFRIVFYLPAIISAVALVKSYENFISPAGPLGSLMRLLGKPIPPEGLLGKVSTATPAIVFYFVWTGFSTNVILFGGVMSRIPVEVLESARLDGCGAWRELYALILPLIWPTVSTMIIFAFTGIFNASRRRIQNDGRAAEKAAPRPRKAMDGRKQAVRVRGSADTPGRAYLPGGGVPRPPARLPLCPSWTRPASISSAQREKRSTTTTGRPPSRPAYSGKEGKRVSDTL